MSETLASAARKIAREIPGCIVVDGTATHAGSTTTLRDTTAWYVSPTSLPPDDYYNGGTLWFLSCTNTTLNGDTSLVTDFVSSTGVYTFGTITASTASGDTYSASNREYPRFILRQAVNYALREAGGEDLQDTSLTSVTDQMTYDLPTGVFNVLRVEIATSTSSPYGYKPLNHWREINDDIAFDEGFQLKSAGYTIRLTYRIPFTELTADSSALPDLVDMNWVIWAGVAYCLRWKMGLTDGDNASARMFLKESLENAEKMKRIYKPKVQQMERDWPASPWERGPANTAIWSSTSVRLR